MSENTAVVEATELEATELLTIEEVIATLVGTLPESVTPYGIHKVVNGTFEAFDNVKRIVPQMMYNYARNGMIAGKESKGRKEYTHDETVTFVTKFVNKYL